MPVRIYISVRWTYIYTPDIFVSIRALTSLNISDNNIGEVLDIEQARSDVAVLLEQYGTSYEAMQEHFEEPSNESTAATVDMVRTTA